MMGGGRNDRNAESCSGLFQLEHDSTIRRLRLIASCSGVPMRAPTRESQEASGAVNEARRLGHPSPGAFRQEDSRMAAQGPRSASNMVFVVLLAGAVVLGLVAVMKFVSAVNGGPY